MLPSVQFANGTWLHDVGHRLGVIAGTQLGWRDDRPYFFIQECISTLACYEPV